MKSYILWGCFFGATAVIFGALGAHALKQHLNAEQLLSFETGVRYQMYHALVLLLIGFQNQHSKSHSKTLLIFLVTGIFLFSWSIYLLSTQSILDVNFSFLGPITPIGGVLLIVSWIYLAVLFMKRKTGKSDNLNTQRN
ncbi:MAG: DUF423 domain-containing protein [Flavobacterium sp.]